MAHELEIMENGEAAYFGGRGKTAWHGLGTTIEGLATAEEALKLAGLDWEVTKEPVYQAIKRDGGGPRYQKIDGKYATTRSSDGKVLGIVGGDYTICNNAPAFAFMDNMIDSGEAIFDTAGAMFGGKRVFISALLPATVNVAGMSAEEHEIYMLFSNSHDGSTAITLDITLVRVVCRNTQRMAQASAKASWKLRHTTTLEGRLAEAQQALQVTHNFVDAFQLEAQKMLEVELNEEQFKGILEASFPEQKLQKAKNIDAVLANWLTSETLDDSIRETGWGAYNALTEWMSWGKEYRSDEARVKCVIGGWGDSIVNRATGKILELAR